MQSDLYGHAWANTIAFVLTDGTNTLSRFSTTTIVQPATIKTLNFKASPVVNSVALSLANPTVNAGTVANDLLTVSAKDLAGNTIVGPGQFIDANGNPVALISSLLNNRAGGRGTVSIIGPSRITGPGQAAIGARYDGNRLASSTISVTANSPVVSSFTSATLTTVPYVLEHTVANNPFGITTNKIGNFVGKIIL